MRDSYKIKIEGGKELAENIRRLGIKIEEAITPGLDKGGEIVRVDASSRAPRRRGKLAADIVKSKVEKNEIKVGPGKDVWYGKFPELGTSRMSARPYLRPALDENKDEINEAIRKELSKVIEKAGR
ncbi:hypothetical protein ES695_05175 [Candidatus Atribacteria bacterium 1244-E10-H5-B2]|nr:MAG: hypothetical protein ES695_05175 [Candidatus Atribacteria bacterium 1244-E10-H5-B2]